RRMVVQLFEERRRHVKALRDPFERRSIAERGQLRLLDQIRRDLRFKRTFEIVGANRVRRQRRLRGVAAERVPRVAVRLPRDGQLTRLLQRDDGVREVVARLAVDLARRKSLAIEQDLKRNVIAAGQRRRRGARLFWNGRVSASRWGRRESLR